MPHKLAQNVLNLLGRLPQHAHLRGPQLSHLLRDLPAKLASEISGDGLSTLYKAREQFDGDNLGDLAAAYAHDVQRERVSDTELESIQALIRSACANKQGQPLQHLTDAELYQRYLQQYAQSLVKLLDTHSDTTGSRDDAALNTLRRKFAEHQQQVAFLALARAVAPGSRVSAAMAGGHQPGPIDAVLRCLNLATAPRSREIFERAKGELHVQKTHDDFGQFDCSHCAQGNVDQAAVRRLSALVHLLPVDAKALAQARDGVAAFRDHDAVVHAQTMAYEKALADPDPEHAVIVWDFGSLDAHANIGESRQQQTFHALMLVIERPNHPRVYVDFLAKNRDEQSPDLFFIRAALLFLLHQTPFLSGLSRVTFVSDTCAGQFRSRYAFAQIGSFQERSGIMVRLLFKAARHGKGIADAHKGHLSRMLVRYFKRLTQMRHEGPESAPVVLSPFTDADSLALFLSTAFKTVEYHAFVLQSIDRNPALNADVRAVPDTMQIHDVTFDTADTLRVKHLSSDERADIINMHFYAPYSIEGTLVSANVAHCVCFSLYLSQDHKLRSHPERVTRFGHQLASEQRRSAKRESQRPRRRRPNARAPLAKANKAAPAAAAQRARNWRFRLICHHPNSHSTRCAA